METVSMPTPVDPFIGKTIGNCEILEKLNEGGTALIYRAHNTRFDLDRVVKILKPSLIDEEDFFVRFRQEAQLVAPVAASASGTVDGSLSQERNGPGGLGRRAA